jgi:hypothetical protein
VEEQVSRIKLAQAAAETEKAAKAAKIWCELRVATAKSVVQHFHARPVAKATTASQSRAKKK